jgi:hypothetical protein
MTVPHAMDAGSGRRGSDFVTQWHYRPTVPIQVSPIFAWPPDAPKIAKWIRDSWFPITERTILLGVALLSWFCFQPPLQQARGP